MTTNKKSYDPPRLEQHGGVVASTLGGGVETIEMVNPPHKS